jgi:hypothetical protein
VVVYLTANWGERSIELKPRVTYLVIFFLFNIVIDNLMTMIGRSASEGAPFSGGPKVNGGWKSKWQMDSPLMKTKERDMG